ncbi:MULTISPECIES: hypothetical protein [unclassified Streptomyces]|uniref:hypothetical protein n=1 Tax=unclassified Streptomyces TaxID=2593676 RepID=UPI0033C40FAD
MSGFGQAECESRFAVGAPGTDVGGGDELAVVGEVAEAWPAHMEPVHWLKQNKENKQPYCQQMKPLLDTYADRLAQAVDAERSGHRLARSLAG